MMSKSKIKNMIKNYTPHEIVVYKENGKDILKSFPCVGQIRLTQETISSGRSIEDIPLTFTKFGSNDIELPKIEGTFYIVSSLVCQANPDRKDFLIVNETVRDENGRILGCKSFSRNPFYKRGGRR